MRLILVSQLHDTHILNFARVFNQTLPSCIANFERFVIFGPICWHLCTWESWTGDCQRTFNGKCNAKACFTSPLLQSLDIIIPWIVFSKNGKLYLSVWKVWKSVCVSGKKKGRVSDRKLQRSARHNFCFLNVFDLRSWKGLSWLSCSRNVYIGLTQILYFLILR